MMSEFMNLLYSNSIVNAKCKGVSYTSLVGKC